MKRNYNEEEYKRSVYEYNIEVHRRKVLIVSYLYFNDSYKFCSSR